MEEGRFRPSGNTFVADYFLKDHLGNVRMMIAEDGTVLEETSYYPFGLIQKGISTQALGNFANKDKTFQGQKFDDDLGLNYYSFKWRNHDPQIGRFIEVDPLSEDYVYNSTYAFSENKVTNHIELEGLEAIPLPLPLLPPTAPAGSNYNLFPGLDYTIKRNADRLAVEGVVIAVDIAKKGVVQTLVGGVVSAIEKVFSNSEENIGTKNNGTFNGKNDTESKTANEGLRNAKEQNGIARSQQPDKTIKPNTPEGDKAGLDNRNVKQHEYTNSKGEKIIIRQDKAAKYNEGGKGDQKPHFNAGENGTKLKQHHYY